MNRSAHKPDGKIGFSTKYMDLSKDPFNDFYLYSTGRWIKKHPVPPDKSRFGSFNQLEDKNNEVLRKIIEASSDKKGSVEKKVNDLYTSFMDTKTVEKLRFKPIEGLMNEVDNVKDIHDLNRYLQETGKKGMKFFFDFGSSEDKKDSSIYSFYLGQGGLSLPDKDYYLGKQHTKILEEFKSHIKRMFSLYGLNKSEIELCSDAVIGIETYLANASRSKVELRDEVKNYNRVNFKDIQSKFKNIDINSFYSNLDAPKVKFLVFGQPEFFGKVERITDNFSLDQIKRFLKWKLLSGSAAALHSEIDEENFDFFGRKLLGIKKHEPRWKRAIYLIEATIGEAIGELYVKETFSPEARKKAKELVEDIKEIFKDRLKNLTWMSKETKKEAIKKFSMLNVKIGHPEKFRDYSSIKIDKGDLFGNITRCAEFEVKRQAHRVGESVDKTEWLMTPAEVNAYYNPSQNELVFPAGILQPPFFDPKMDAAVNYGGIGGVIAHEITHGYDDQGRLYDGLGTLKEWWTPLDSKKFKNLAHKVSKFYSSLEILPGLKVNGDLTLGENIADLGAVAIAYDALGRYLSRHGEQNTRIDGFTQTQRFYIAWAQVWKENITDGGIKLQVMVDPHSPGKVRGSIPAITHPEFQKTFRDKSKLSGLPMKYVNLNMW